MTSEHDPGDLARIILDFGDDRESVVRDIGERMFAQLLDGYRQGGEHPREVIEALTGLAASPDARRRAAGGRLIFTHLAEPLGDAFEPGLAALYDAVFSQILNNQRRLPGGEPIDRALAAFGLRTEHDMFSRRHHLRTRDPGPLDCAQIRTAIILSRITVGADVAITSVLIRRLRQTCPDARIVLVGQPRIGELFAGDRSVEVLPAPYPRRGTLTERLRTWIEMLDLISDEVRALEACEVVFLDTDSRLTQLGLLPVSGDDRYYRIFESRSSGHGGADPLTVLAARWARSLLPGSDDLPESSISLDPEQARLGQTSVEHLQASSRGRVVSVSFGVGGNADKRAGETFEVDVVQSLLRAGHTVVLDRGAAEDRRAADAILDRLASRGVRIYHADDRNAGTLASASPIPQVVAWTGGLGVFSSLIAASDLYIGYDSAFQHIAAAVGTPLIAIVVPGPGPTFRHRWAPHSTAPVRILETTEPGRTPDPGALASAVVGAAAALL